MKSKHIFSMIIMLLFAIIGMYCVLIGVYAALDYRADGITWYEHLMTLLVSCQTMWRVKERISQKENEVKYE